MNKIKRMMALALVLLMCMAMAAPVSAAEIEPESEQMVKTIYLGDDIVIKVIRGTNKTAPLMLPLSDITNSDAAVDALAASKATHTFWLLDGAGTRCTEQISNNAPKGSATKMEVTFAVTANGISETDTEVLAAQDNTTFFAYSRNGNDLVGKVVTTIQALNANSVRYTYTIQQMN